MPDGIFLQLEVDFADDEDVAKLARYTRPGEARACRDLLVQMWLFCKRKPTDGHVPADVVGRLAYPDTMQRAIRDADRLVECEIAERTDTGYFLPGYLKHNKSLEEIERAREARADVGSESGSFGNHFRWHVRRGVVNPACPHCADRVSVGSASGVPERGGSGSDRVSVGSASHIDRAIATDTANTDKDSGEHRNETLRAPAAPERPEEARCTKHLGELDPPRCRGCMKAREQAENANASAAEARRQARINCRRCAGTGWIEAVDGSPVSKCDHRPPLEVVK